MHVALQILDAGGSAETGYTVLSIYRRRLRRSGNRRRCVCMVTRLGNRASCRVTDLWQRLYTILE